MRQRAMIAMALACNPDVLIADEPTTALDVTIQAQIIELIDRLKDEFNSAVILITHDLGVVADIADEIVVMYAGRVVERGAEARALLRPAASVHVGPARLDPAARPAEAGAAALDQGHAAVADQRCRRAASSGPRCPHAFEKCTEEPPLENRVEEPGHLDRCWLTVEEKRRLRDATIAGTEEAA